MNQAAPNASWSFNIRSTTNRLIYSQTNVNVTDGAAVAPASILAGSTLASQHVLWTLNSGNTTYSGTVVRPNSRECVFCIRY